MEFIETVVSNALEELSEDMATICIIKNYFVTRVQEEQEPPVKINGVYRVERPKCYVIIDGTREQTFDEEIFRNRSNELYRLFFSINRWYNC